jgi:hypothetical protein
MNKVKPRLSYLDPDVAYKLEKMDHEITKRDLRECEENFEDYKNSI